MVRAHIRFVLSASSVPIDTPTDRATRYILAERMSRPHPSHIDTLALTDPFADRSVCTQQHGSTHARAHSCARTHEKTRTHTRTHTRKHIHARAHTHTHTRTQARTCTHTYASHTHASHTHACTQARTRTLTHAHACTAQHRSAMRTAWWRMRPSGPDHSATCRNSAHAANDIVAMLHGMLQHSTPYHDGLRSGR